MSNLLRLTFGSGLDRASGQTVADASSMEDLRNVHLSDGRAEIRLGLERALAVAGAQSILAIHPMRSKFAGLGIVYQSKKEARLMLASIDASGQILAERTHPLFTFDIEENAPQVVIVSDSYDSLFFSHAERVYGRRQPSKIFRVSTPDVAPVELTGDFGEVDPTPLRFYTSDRYLEYLMGAGYGDPSRDDAPNLLRLSLPGLPDKFDVDHYFPVGQPDDPILCVRRLPSGALIFKGLETYRFEGSTRATFGAFQSDLVYGIAGPRLAVVVGGLCYFWSWTGPRVSGGGASEEMAIPLNLRRAAPWNDDWDRDQAIATYQPDRREVLFIFGQFAYVWHLDTRRWSYREFASGAIGAAGVVDVAVSSSRDPITPQPAIVSAACVSFAGDIYPVIVSAACDTAPPAEVEFVGMIVGTNKPLLGDASTLVGVMGADAPPSLGAPANMRGPYSATAIGVAVGVDGTPNPSSSQPWDNLPQSVGEGRYEMLIRIVRGASTIGRLEQQFPATVKRVLSSTGGAGFPRHQMYPIAEVPSISTPPYFGEAGASIQLIAVPCEGTHLFSPQPNIGGGITALYGTNATTGITAPAGFVQTAFAGSGTSISFRTGFVIKVRLNQVATVLVTVDVLDPEYEGVASYGLTFADLAAGEHELYANMATHSINFTKLDANDIPNPAVQDPRWFPRCEVTVDVRYGAPGAPQRRIVDASEQVARITGAIRPAGFPPE